MSTLYRITNSTRLFLFLVGFVFLMSAAIFCGQAARLYRQYLYHAYSADYREPVHKDFPTLRNAYLEVLKAPSAIACFVRYILALIIAWL